MKSILLFAFLLISPGRFLAASEKHIDPDRSVLTIHVGKTGLLSAAGHEHTVRAPIADGTIDDGAEPRVSFRVDAAQLLVLPEDHQDEIQHSMQVRVLDSSHFPEIRFASNRVQSAGAANWDVRGSLTLHGETKPLDLRVQYRDGRYLGSVKIKQTDFGIQPVSAAGGAVRVKNELTIDFAITTK